MNNIMYYAANAEERRFDDQIRTAVRKHGSKADMALYIQNQEILSILRMIRDMSKLKLEVTTDD